MTTVAQAIARSGLAPIDAQVLLAHALGVSRTWLIAHADDALPDDGAAAFAALAQRRRSGEPVAYLTGRREFFGLSLAVSPAVLIPRPETETLVECRAGASAAQRVAAGARPRHGVGGDRAGDRARAARGARLRLRCERRGGRAGARQRAAAGPAQRALLRRRLVRGRARAAVRRRSSPTRRTSPPATRTSPRATCASSPRRRSRRGATGWLRCG